MLLLPNAGRVGVNVPAGTNPTHNLQVNGTVRVQNLPVSTPNCLIVGTNQGNAQDNQMSRLDFTGNANQVLLGNGTWGTAPSTSEAHNGLSRSTLDPTRIALGQNEGQLFNPARFLNNREVPLNGYNLRISTLQPGQAGQVIIGNYGGPTGNTRLVVENDIYTLGQMIRCYPHDGTFSFNRMGLAVYSEKAEVVRGVFANASEGVNMTIAVNGRATSDYFNVQNIGGLFQATSSPIESNIENNGVRGYAAQSRRLNIGGKFKAESTMNSSLNIGIYAENGGVGGYAAYLVGAVFTSGPSLWLSDANFKDSIVALEASDTLFDLLNPVSFKFNEEAQERLKTGGSVKYGFLAQEIEPIYPWMVQDVSSAGRIGYQWSRSGFSSDL
jgi:hypothetical protein